MVTALTLGLFGLVLDIIGFIGIFFAKPKPLNRIPNLNIYRSASLGGHNINTDLRHIAESVNKAFGTFNEANIKNEISSKKYFRFVIAGFIFQSVGMLVNLINTINVLPVDISIP